MLILRGFIGLVVLLLLLILAMVGGAHVTSRLLGLPRFRWFSARPVDAPAWRRFTVRAVSTLAPLAVCVLVLTGGYFLLGEAAPSTTVNVMPGPAKEAGMLDGDRVISIDGVKMESWEAIRATAKPGTGPKTIEIERAGSRRLLNVHSGADGRLGIMMRPERRSVGLSTALQRGLETPVKIYGAVLKGAVAASEGTAELAGPVSTMRGAGQAAEQGSLLTYLVTLGIYMWPWLLGLHVLDAATLALFAATHGWALGGEVPERLARLCRLHQALGLSLVGSLLSLVLSLFVGLPIVGAVVYPLVLLLSATVIGSYVLTWLVAKERWRQNSFWLVPAVPTVLIPCASQLVAFSVLHWLRSELKRSQLELGWFTAAPRPLTR